MKKYEENYLTESPILRALISLALPIMASSFFSTAYNITDMFWTGKLGAKTLAGIGTGGMYLWLTWSFSTLARMGGQVLTAQKLGAGEREQAQQYVTASLRLVAVLAVAASAACLLLTRPMVRLLGVTDEETTSAAVVYLRITGGMLIFPFFNNVLTGLFTAQGDSLTPLISNTTGLIVNMVLDPLLVLGYGPFPRLEVVGAAAATVTAEAVSSLIFVVVQIMRRDKKRLHLAGMAHLSMDCYASIIKIGFPSAAQGFLYCAYSMFLTNLCAGFGSEAIAAQRLGGQVESITWNAADGFGSAMNAFTGQNYGAGKYDRIKKGYRVSFVTVVLWGALITLIFEMFPHQLAGLFFYEEKAAAMFVSYLKIVGLAEMFMSVELMANGAISGFGETKTASVISIVLTGLRVPLGFFLTRTSLGLDGVWWALALTSMSKGIVLDQAFRHIFRRKRQAGN